MIERRSRQPLLPMRLLENRTRAGSYLAVLFAGVGTFGVFLFVTYYMQQTLGFSPLTSGLAFLPMIGTVIVTSVGVNALLLARLGPRPLVVAGMLLDALGLVLLTRLEVESTYAGGILPSLIVVGAGLGLVFPTATNTATARVAPAESGVASSLVNVGQQVGGSLGTALLNTVAVSATTAYLTHAPRRRRPRRERDGARLHGRVLVVGRDLCRSARSCAACCSPAGRSPAPAEPVPVAAP